MWIHSLVNVIIQYMLGIVPGVYVYMVYVHVGVMGYVCNLQLHSLTDVQ